MSEIHSTHGTENCSRGKTNWVGDMHKWEDISALDLKAIGCECHDCIQLAQDWVNCGIL
jgi:hypothetical protein